MTKLVLIERLLSRPSVFPKAELASEDGLLCFSDQLSVELLVDAYSHGIFPWPQEGYPIMWFSPDPRGILVNDKLHKSKSQLKSEKKLLSHCRFERNSRFEEVIRGCATVVRKGQAGTWITPKMVEVYINLNSVGAAESFELIDEGDQLVAGLYGVRLKNYFSAESMFGTKPDSSKIVLSYASTLLASEGVTWIDTQMLTQVTSQLGAELISRNQFLILLREALH
ncbi:MAG: leucyl/phenylalanyl-tRNA--protein transferase [Bdellovibrionales bacterium CG10_big_fil_rev_8_21_14_0_10_45_34]|nr:MAG: leucyl/phenylalanyl-tRNA--protein transferase [Bdellovibrionales bacterium CG10_big_fil_rev_8_21_14_0_10_45_34]